MFLSAWVKLRGLSSVAANKEHEFVASCRIPAVLVYRFKRRRADESRFVMSSPPLEASRHYWDGTADTYDQVFPETLVGKAQRNAVWRELDRAFQSGQRVLELNCGTGIDAVHLASRGVRSYLVISLREWWN